MDLSNEPQHTQFLELLTAMNVQGNAVTGITFEYPVEVDGKKITVAYGVKISNEEDFEVEEGEEEE